MCIDNPLLKYYFKHYSDTEMRSKNYFTLYEHTLQWFISITDNQ